MLLGLACMGLPVGAQVSLPNSLTKNLKKKIIIEPFNSASGCTNISYLEIHLDFDEDMQNLFSGGQL